jgi:hypothetical protein
MLQVHAWGGGGHVLSTSTRRALTAPHRQEPWALGPGQRLLEQQPDRAAGAHLSGWPARRAQRAAAAETAWPGSWGGSPPPAGPAGGKESGRGWQAGAASPQRCPHPEPPLAPDPISWACSVSSGRPGQRPTCTVVSSSATRSPKLMMDASSWYVSYALHRRASLYAAANSAASLASATSPNRSAWQVWGAGGAKNGWSGCRGRALRCARVVGARPAPPPMGALP